MTKLSSMKIRNLLLPVVLWIVCGCGVKGRPLPPEYPPYIGRGMVEESLHQEAANIPVLETPKETEDKKPELQNNSTVPTPDAKGNAGKSKKNSSSKKNKEKKK